MKSRATYFTAGCLLLGALSGCSLKYYTIGGYKIEKTAISGITPEQIDKIANKIDVNKDRILSAVELSSVLSLIQTREEVKSTLESRVKR